MAGATMLTLDGPSAWQALDEHIEHAIQSGAIPGAGLIASRRGKTVHEVSLGTYMDLGKRDKPVTPDVLHPFYSYSKLVSSTLVVMAAQDGLLQYDSPVSTYIPEFKGGGKDAITLRHLLTHSAGIPSVPLGGARTEDEWKAGVASLCAAKTEWEPGSRCAYHGLTGHFVAAECVRRVSAGRSWEAICRERLFGPLGADSLTFVTPADSRATSITPQPKDAPASHYAAFGMAGHPAGGCFGTLRDGLKVLQLHLNKGSWQGRRLVKPAALAEMHRVQYARQIERAIEDGKAPMHDTWGLGILVRGASPRGGGHDWFGMGGQSSPTVFGHAGIDTVIGVADMANGKALMFASTDSPKPPEKTVPLRNGVTDRAFEAMGR